MRMVGLPIEVFTHSPTKLRQSSFENADSLAELLGEQVDVIQRSEEAVHIVICSSAEQGLFALQTDTCRTIPFFRCVEPAADEIRRASLRFTRQARFDSRINCTSDLNERRVVGIRQQHFQILRKRLRTRGKSQLLKLALNAVCRPHASEGASNCGKKLQGISQARELAQNAIFFPSEKAGANLLLDAKVGEIDGDRCHDGREGASNQVAGESCPGFRDPALSTQRDNCVGPRGQYESRTARCEQDCQTKPRRNSIAIHLVTVPRPRRIVEWEWA